MNEAIKDYFHFMRVEVENLKKKLWSMKNTSLDPNMKRQFVGEYQANLMLAYRHLEDARMRMGKAIQALDSGKSHYTQIDIEGAKRAKAEGEE